MNVKGRKKAVHAFICLFISNSFTLLSRYKSSFFTNHHAVKKTNKYEKGKIIRRYIFSFLVNYEELGICNCTFVNKEVCKCISSIRILQNLVFSNLFIPTFLVHLTITISPKSRNPTRHTTCSDFFVTIRSFLFCFVLMYNTAWLKLFVFFGIIKH